MCGICGCGHSERHSVFKPAPAPRSFVLTQGVNDQNHLLEDHVHRIDVDSGKRLVKVEQDLLAKNNAYAAQNRAYFGQNRIFALNLVSSPGAGKTTLLVETIKKLKDAFPIAVIEGDQQTEHDAERIRATGVAALQINTGHVCHLDAHAVGHAVAKFDLKEQGLLFIENVGNLVCPSSFDLGEAHKVVVLSVTEGDDKPVKYPDMFHAASLMIINKTDLLPYVDFDLARCIGYAKKVNPRIEIIQLSAYKRENLTAWTGWITEKMKA